MLCVRVNYNQFTTSIINGLYINKKRTDTNGSQKIYPGKIYKERQSYRWILGLSPEPRNIHPTFQINFINIAI
jgi:hypothetical protein